jgi:hypothetical protein
MREASTYRGARRNATRATGAIMARLGAEVRPGTLFNGVRLNRSEKWSRAKSYAIAREIAIARHAKVQHENVV